jgi:hypothetical protein
VDLGVTRSSRVGGTSISLQVRPDWHAGRACGAASEFAALGLGFESFRVTALLMKAEMSEAGTKRVEITFQVFQYDDGQPFIALTFRRDGETMPVADRLFTLDLTQGTSPIEANTLAHLLRRKVTHLSMTSVEGGPIPEPPTS